MSEPFQPPDGTAAILESVGCTGSFTVEPLSGGANNRVYRVEAEALTAPLVLKHFFQSPGDTRDRFHAENSFYTYLGKLPAQPRTARALAWSRPHGLGLFSWIEGRKLTVDVISENSVEQALQFFIALNPPGQHANWADMSPASEACFSLQTHLDCVERRVLRLETGLNPRRERSDDEPPITPLEQEAAAFVAERLRPCFDQLRDVIRGSGANLSEELPAARRCVSPSDFGFHNALSDSAGALHFFDFEYAGVDDPAKFFCDFLSQPALPVPHALWRHSYSLLQQALPDLMDAGKIQLLLPLYQLKWCCIVLNEFLPTGKDRRRFASPSGARADKQRLQLDKAKRSLAALTVDFDFLQPVISE
ncbi:aminoglycoside phosphotransferase family protein [Verrucomicrobia bacterium LW23]|nr:aminoglycoside phosphotransferase family protein [Verrucomicrobia bacterium LW23]